MIRSFIGLEFKMTCRPPRANYGSLLGLHHNLFFVNILVSCLYFYCVIFRPPVISSSVKKLRIYFDSLMFSKVTLDEDQKDQSIVIVFYFIISVNVPLLKCLIKPVNYEAVRHASKTCGQIHNLGLTQCSRGHL